MVVLGFFMVVWHQGILQAKPVLTRRRRAGGLRLTHACTPGTSRHHIYALWARATTRHLLRNYSTACPCTPQQTTTATSSSTFSVCAHPPRQQQQQHLAMWTTIPTRYVRGRGSATSSIQRYGNSGHSFGLCRKEAGAGRRQHRVLPLSASSSIVLLRVGSKQLNYAAWSGP
jgi:hypothetical protein